ncbi:hypothetical protein BFS14_23840 [Serratia fonticola]|uniref:hypothetical protein n=1 Tax=Serratia fonticola TaxID=47917 RepID=UPI0008FCE0A8|nr:hypothetical protein [Serratia fonticola]OIX91185.1 hypothetical protein BFS14_23840 [Serratia fonticola]
MNSTKTIFWHAIVVIAAITYLSYSFRLDVTFKDVESLISILQNTSVMIFTIMGIWIAYVYPNAVLRIVQPSKVAAVFSDKDLERVRLLIGVVVISAFILALLVFGVAAKVFITKTNIFSQHKPLFTGISLWCLLAMTYAQLFCIYAVIASSVSFLIDLKNLKSKKRLSEKLDGKLK